MLRKNLYRHSQVLGVGLRKPNTISIDLLPSRLTSHAIGLSESDAQSF